MKGGTRVPEARALRDAWGVTAGQVKALDADSVPLPPQAQLAMRAPGSALPLPRSTSRRQSDAVGVASFASTALSCPPKRRHR